MVEMWRSGFVAELGGVVVEMCRCGDLVELWFRYGENLVDIWT